MPNPAFAGPEDLQPIHVHQERGEQPERLTGRARLKAWLVKQGMEGRWPRWAVSVAINLLGLRGA